jgi:GDP-D-mannose dehydratase
MQLVGNTSKAREQLGWDNEIRFRELVNMMADTDPKLFTK